MTDNILYTISEEYDTFSRMHKKLADYILQNSDKAILMSISNLSEESGVSEATIVRFTYRLGFDGYKEFQKALLNSIKYSITTLERLKTAKNLSKEEVVSQQINSDINDINATFLNLDPNNILKAAKMLDKAENVYILGLRTSFILSQYLSHYLKMMDFNVVTVEGTMMDPYEQLTRMTEKDILVSISFPRYSQRSIHSTRLIRDKGYKIISITDSESTPISKLSDVNLIARLGMVSFVDSLASPIVLLNALLAAIGQVTEKNIKGNLKKLEEYWESAETYERI